MTLGLVLFFSGLAIVVVAGIISAKVVAGIISAKALFGRTTKTTGPAPLGSVEWQRRFDERRNNFDRSCSFNTMAKMMIPNLIGGALMISGGVFIIIALVRG